MNPSASQPDAPGLVEHHLSGDAALAMALAHDIAQRLRDAVALRGTALLAVSGGRSPVALFQALSQQALPWAHVTVLLADERCVPFAHPDSNARLVHEHLLQGPAAAACWVPLVNPDLPTLPEPPPATNLQALQQAAETRLATLPWPLDVAVLGMGLDAHTASFFPGAPGLHAALTTDARCAWVLPDAQRNQALHARITLSLNCLLGARQLCLPLSGAAKLGVYALARQQATPERPISLLLCQTDTPVSVWISS